jgi:hypothetical protein
MGVSVMCKAPVPILVPHSFSLDELLLFQREKYPNLLVVQLFFSGLRSHETTARKEARHG